jgi:bifunctional non-homologous end joining protein LigD
MSASDPILTYVPPLLCTQADRPPAGASWVHEIKFDGYRIGLAVNGGRVSLFSKNGLDWTHRFPELALEASALPDCLLDGEMVALDEQGRSDFEGLLGALSSRRTSGLVFYAFDALSIAGEDLRALPYSERKRRLEGLLELCDGPACDHIAVVESHAVDGRSMLEAARGLELEGIVSKRLDAPYQSGRSPSWVKTKLRPSEEVVIGGWTTTSGADLVALLAGVWRGGELAYVGRVGTGFGGKAGSSLLSKLRKLSIPQSPFVPGAGLKETKPRWVRPELVAEIEVGGWVAGKVRQASFKRLREDIAPSEVQARDLREPESFPPDRR